ncbi:8489_t:CDS:2 [Diversispora eburnea]|uniref:Mediator of RNA polymerase II transcription subunit 18 n=1 Tax=Diversispora eburnea TaxID=1213867 RepID=A0A9N8ZCK5_9GLOM|nr:8489_t:CDS:2 [Diversispora eburnea]
MTSLLNECSLHGRIPENLKPKLIERLEGICGTTTPVNVFEHEIGIVQTPEGARNDDLVLRLKSPLDENDLTKRNPDTTGHALNVTVRRVIYAKIFNGDALKFMSVLGYKYAYEYVKKGIIFTFRDSLKISIFQIFTLDKVHDVTSLKPFDDNNYIVEVASILAPSELVESKSQELISFRETLKGVINLHRVNHLHLKNQIYYT